MPKYWTELTQGQTFSRTSEEDGIHDTAQRVFKVLLVSPAEVFDPQAYLGVYIGTIHPYNNNLICFSFDAKFDGESRMVTLVTFNYRSFASAAASSGRPDPKIIQPEVRPANWSTETSLMEIPAPTWCEFGSGKWVVPINPAVTITYSTKKKSFTLKWVPAVNQTVASPVTGYRIEYSTNYGMTWRLATTAPASAKSYSRKIARDTMWRIAAVNDVNNGLGPYMWADENGVDGDRVVAAPATPTGFAPVSGPGGLRFRWNEPATNNGTALTKYRVYRQTGTAAPVMVLETTERLNVTVPRGTVLPAYFSVTAVNNAGESAPSQTVMVGR